MRIAIFLLLASCGGARVEHIGDGTVSILCPPSDCFEGEGRAQAAKECPNGYDVVSAGRSYEGSGSLLIRCR